MKNGIFWQRLSVILIIVGMVIAGLNIYIILYVKAETMPKIVALEQKVDANSKKTELNYKRIDDHIEDCKSIHKRIGECALKNEVTQSVDKVDTRLNNLNTKIDSMQGNMATKQEINDLRKGLDDMTKEIIKIIRDNHD